MELDELLDDTGPKRGAGVNQRGTKFKPRQKSEPSESLSVPASDFVKLLKKEDISIKSDMGSEYVNNATAIDEKVKPEFGEDEKGDFMDMEGEVEPENQVVREIDIYFIPAIDPKSESELVPDDGRGKSSSVSSFPQMHVFQYPLRPLWRPCELDEKCKEVRVKPASGEVEVDLAVDVESKNYDSAADGKLLTKKQILTSVWQPHPPATCYAVGVITRNKLHLHPVHAIVQLRPSMQHLDKDSKRQTGMLNDVKDRVKSEVSQEVKPVGAPEKSKHLEQAKNSGEGWVSLNYHTASSQMAKRYLHSMTTQEGPPIHFSMSSSDYLSRLCGTSAGSLHAEGPHIRWDLPLRERFKTWFLEGRPIHRFDTLKYLAPDESDDEILRVLQEHGRLVQGLWVPKSSLLYGTDEGIEVSARDYVLILFSKNVCISNSEISKRPPKIVKAIKNVLNILAVERSAFDDWKLKELPDTNFVKLNPSVVKRQEDEWAKLEKKIHPSGGKTGPRTKTVPESSTISNQATPIVATKVASRAPTGAASRSGMPEEVRDDIVKALQKLFKRDKVCSSQQITEQLRGMAIHEYQKEPARGALTAAQSIDAFPNEVQAIINQLVVNIHGICLLKSSPDHPQYDAFRKVVIDLFMIEEPNAKLKKARILEAAKEKLSREISQTECQKVLQELCVSKGSAWMLRSADGNSK